MENQEILKGNRLIAEFMTGRKFVNKSIFINIDGIENLFFENNLLYHADWNWLMEVVNKISMINHNDKNKQRFIFNTNRCAKYNINENDKPIKIRIKGVMINFPRPFIEIDSFNELEGTYLAVIEFINWYNNQK